MEPFWYEEITNKTPNFTPYNVKLGVLFYLMFEVARLVHRKHNSIFP